jgi:hypothetical protein
MAAKFSGQKYILARLVDILLINYTYIFSSNHSFTNTAHNQDVLVTRQYHNHRRSIINEAVTFRSTYFEN